MTDLGHLLTGTETGIARARGDETLASAALDRTVQRVRRRRGLRHTRDGVVGVALAGIVGSVAWWAGAPDHAPQPAETAVATPAPSATTPAPSPSVSALADGPTEAIAVPQGAPEGLLDGAKAGWMLAVMTQQQPGGPADSGWRNLVDLVAPTGERTTLLETVPAWTSVDVLDWVAGERTALVAAWKQLAPGFVYGRLDLATGELTLLPRLGWGMQYAGTASTGETLWFTQDAPPDIDTTVAGGPSPAFAPGVVVVGDTDPYGFGPDGGAQDGSEQGGTAPDGAAGAVAPAVPEVPALTLRALDARGAVRDVAALGWALPRLSPDGEWALVRNPDGTPGAVRVRAAQVHALDGLPTDPACRQAGWSGKHELLVGCPVPGTERWELHGHDLAGESPVRAVATTDHEVRSAWPLGDGRVGIGLAVLSAACMGVSDPAILDDGVVTPLTGQWGAHDHGDVPVFAAGAVHTHLNGCATRSAGPRRDVRTDLTTGAVVTLGGVDDDPGAAAAAEGWENVGDEQIVVGRAPGEVRVAPVLA